MQPSSQNFISRYPSVARAAKVLGVSRSNLWRALNGMITNHALVRSYAQLVMPGLLAILERGQFPVGTLLRLPSSAEARAHAAALAEHSKRSGRTITLCSPVHYCVPVIPATGDTAFSPKAATQTDHYISQK